VVFFVESELWPNMLYYLHEQGIPTYLLNARCSDKSLSRFYIAKKLLRLLPFKLFDAVYVSSQSMLEHVKALGGRTVTLMPSLKTISEKLPVNPESVAKIKRVIGGRKRWIAVSTHPGEEEIIINVHKLLKAAFDDVMTIIAVRHPHRVSDVAELCLRYGLVCTLHSSVLQNDISESANDDIYIVDQMGCLGDFFELVDTVLVCGSLIQNIGGHNFLEPIRFGCNVATGKYFDNFRDVYQHVKRECVIATDTKEICGFVKESFMHFSRDGRTLTNPDFIEKWEDVVRSIMNQLS
jgi:3-deoxy-D-manno-octulosonic-acid transferase